MKKVLFMLPVLAALFMLSACSNDDEPSVSTFTIINNSEKYETSLDEYLDGTMYEVVAFEDESQNEDSGGSILNET